MELATHASVIGKPVGPSDRKSQVRSTSRRQHTCITTRHEKHGHVATPDGGGANTDDVAHDDAPPWYTNVKESLSRAIYGSETRVT